MTTIKVSQELRDHLAKRKFSDKDTYEDIIWDLLEDTMELSRQTKIDLQDAREEVRTGKTYTLQQVKRELER